MKNRNMLIGIALAAAFGAGTASAATILSNNTAPGDAFTNPAPANLGMAIAGSDWYYNNVRNGATVGINTAYPRSGNGSVLFDAPANGKADIEYLPNAVPVGGNFASTATMGSFALLSSMSYDWYRDNTSTATAHLHPSLRVLLDGDGDLTTTGDRGGLVFERVYNALATPADTWTGDTVSSSTFVWNFGLGLGSEFDIDANGYAYDSTLADWQAFLPTAAIIGFSSGVGSGWGPFRGAVDNIAWTIDGVTATNNFEVRVDDTAVPEPVTLALFGAGFVAAGLARRRRKA